MSDEEYLMFGSIYSQLLHYEKLEPMDAKLKMAVSNMLRTRAEVIETSNRIALANILKEQDEKLPDS